MIMKNLTDDFLCRRAKYAKGNFKERLIALLETRSNFTDESGELLPTAVKDHAWQRTGTLN